MLYAPEAQGSLPRHHSYVREPYTYQPRGGVTTLYRGTSGDKRRAARQAHADSGAVAGSESDAARLVAEEHALAANEEAELERRLQNRLARRLPSYHPLVITR